MLAELLLDLTSATVKLNVLLAEAEEGEFKAVRARLAAFLACVEATPVAPQKREPMGFKVSPKKTSKKTPAKAPKRVRRG